MRIDEIHRLATLPSDTARQDRLSGVVQALNKAALVASDCGLPDLARELCLRQFTALHAAAPLAATTAQYALEPLVNLGRLATRRGDGITAYRIYQDTFHAATTGTTARIDGHDVDFANLLQQPEDRQHLRRFLWAILLADGTRALTTTGRWDDLLPHLQRYNGIGDRMLDGRQAATLSHALRGHTEQALAMLDATNAPQPWEHAVTACLRTLCLHLAGRAHDIATADMIDAYRAMPLQPESVVFHTRLGLCTAELAQAIHPTAAKEITTALVQLAVQTGDAHAASLLAHHGRLHPTADEQALTRVIEASGTGPRAMPQHLLNSLVAATRHALAILVDLLTSARGPDRPHPTTT
ncbi:hypothetical protein AB0K14_19470 [Actinosynnema sp. NPDC050801]|uniref:hypothetical protein n=1 Tax=unclassified Actinosynnema TaxID=2637065 RepID=UPI0033E8E896